MNLYTREEAHAFWKNPDEANQPERYITDNGQSDYLLKIIKQYANPDHRILEVGCNCGRNLDRLYYGGYTNLNGIEINKNALETFATTFPNAFLKTNAYTGPAEEILGYFSKLKERFYLTYTMAVLEHMPNESISVPEDMVKITSGYIITIEDEGAITERHYPRDYKGLFEALGCQQMFSEYTPVVMGEPISKYVTRVFKT